MKRERGENPRRYQSLYASELLYSSAKAGHWETEKADYKSVGVILYDVSQKTCFDVAPSVYFYIGAIVLFGTAEARKMFGSFAGLSYVAIRNVKVTEKLLW